MRKLNIGIHCCEQHETFPRNDHIRTLNPVYCLSGGIRRELKFVKCGLSHPIQSFTYGLWLALESRKFWQYFGWTTNQKEASGKVFFLKALIFVYVKDVVLYCRLKLDLYYTFSSDIIQISLLSFVQGSFLSDARLMISSSLSAFYCCRFSVFLSLVGLSY